MASDTLDATGVAGSPEPTGSVLRNAGFLKLWMAQLVSQTAQNGLMYTLLVLITARTESGVIGSVLVLSFMLPAVLFSLFAGVLVDRWPKRIVLISTNLIRVGICVAYLFFDQHVATLILLTLLFSSVSQFFGPAESSTIPMLVSRHQLISANGLFQLTLTGSQFMGMVILSPLLLKIGGPELFFIGAAVLYVGAAALVSTLPRNIEPPLVTEKLNSMGMVRAIARDVSMVLGVIRRDPLSLLALVQLTMSSSLSMLFGLLVPRFVLDVLDVSPDNAVFVFAPVGVGAVLGLRSLPWLTRHLRKPQIVTIGLFGIAAALVALGSVEFVARALEESGAGELIDEFDEPRFGTLTLSVLVLLTMVTAVPVGFTYALVNAPAQTVIHERAPADMRGRFYGTQLMLANLASLFVLLAVGVLIDAVGVISVLFLYAPIVLAVAIYGVIINRRYGPSDTPLAESG
ncbi:MAG: MFS transporter [Dehalococcoidia bacterium]